MILCAILVVSGAVFLTAMVSIVCSSMTTTHATDATCCFMEARTHYICGDPARGDEQAELGRAALARAAKWENRNPLELIARRLGRA